MLPFSLQIRDGEPVSDQVVRGAQRALLTGELAEGDLFPSVRQLAQSLRISPTTAHKVIQQLKDGGLLVSRPGVGMVVRSPEGPSSGNRRKLLDASCRRLLSEARDLGLKMEEVIQALQETADSLDGKNASGSERISHAANTEP